MLYFPLDRIKFNNLYEKPAQKAWNGPKKVSPSFSEHKDRYGGSTSYFYPDRQDGPVWPTAGSDE